MGCKQSRGTVPIHGDIKVADDYKEALAKATILLQRHDEKVVVEIFSRLGSAFYFRRRNGRIEHLYMAQDDWGQYGYDRKKKLHDNFVKGYKIV